MKKMCMMLAGVVLAAAVGAEDTRWTNNIGLGVSAPLARLSCERMDTVRESGVALGAQYIGYARNGFTVKAALDCGGAFTNDVPLGRSDGWHGGMFADATLGAGYSFVRSEHFLLSATGLVGASISRYTTESRREWNPMLAVADRSYSATFVTVDFGADVTAVYRASAHVGIFAGVQCRYAPGGAAFMAAASGMDEIPWALALNRPGAAELYAVTRGKNNYCRADILAHDIGGSFRAVPVVGVMWRL